MFDPSNLTLGEIAWVEKFTGHSLGEIDKASTALVMTAFVTVMKKREDPKFTAEDAQAFTMAEANDILGTDAEDDAAGEE